jgi:hypothetical protein
MIFVTTKNGGTKKYFPLLFWCCCWIRDHVSKRPDGNGQKRFMIRKSYKKVQYTLTGIAPPGRSQVGKAEGTGDGIL